jgi:hypothetical protein
MRFRLSAVCCACVLSSFVAATSAQDLPTTHDHGITITPDHLTTAIQDTQDFWGPVRKYVVSDEFNVASSELRGEAVAFLKVVHDGLHDRLFQKTEAEALDLIHYLGHRLRRFEVYRRLRATIADDGLMLSLLEKWEQKYREIDQGPAAERAARTDALLAEVRQTMEAAKLPADKLAAAQELWTTQARVFQNMSSTEAGKMMVEFETKAAQLDPQVSTLLLHISNAADWVLITRGDDQLQIGRSDFVSAWDRLHELRGKQTAAAPTAIQR